MKKFFQKQMVFALVFADVNNFMQIFLFCFFAVTALLSAILVITLINPVHSVLFLVLAFLTTSGILFTLHLEFVPLIFIIVYVGAIAVLFLFVVMMLDIKLTSKTNDLFKYIPFGFLVGSFFILEILYVLNDDFCAPQKLINEDFFFWFMCVDTISNIECLGQLLYTYYFIYFLVSGMILLVAMVGSIVLTLNPNKKVKSQTLYKQLSRSANKAIFLARN